ncbi:uncharacterized protein LOC101859492 [Aplysia californica]|uniref:Uncharacterized protein LOC101859492 n=1 Tax=Aplysia californica TaxID=6500 RepID=A0ABM0JT00_APLCA|nr:uncharacterized protein LOC101859492 [Aplysia californica]
MVESINNMNLRFGLRELVYACLCIVLGYLLRVRDSYSLTPMWRKRSEISKFVNGKFTTDVDRNPLPIVTDLEGDGVNEIVLVSNDLVHLNVLAMPLRSEEEDKTLAHVMVKHKAEMMFKGRSKGHIPRPHTVGVGFIEPYLSMMQIRKQVIVVVTDDWQVLCYSHELKLLWYQQLPLPSVDLESIEVKSLSVLVSPFTIEKKHKGLVVIAGSFRHKTHKPDILAKIKEREENKSRNRTLEMPTEEDNETLTHFSTFTLSADDGSLLWKHTAGDFDEQQQNTKGDKAHHWKLSLHHKRIHKGESPWEEYGSQLNDFWPHMWAENSDTEIFMVRVNKQFNTTSRSQKSVPEPSEGVQQTGSALLPEHLIGFSYGGQRPHSDHEHVTNPNSLIIKSPEGIQVLSLVTGQPKTVYRLPADRALYLDVDGDGHVEKVVWDMGQHYSPCFLDIWRVKPVQEQIDQIAVCTSKRLFWTRSWSLEEDVYKKIPPRVIKSVARKTGLLRHFLGHNLFQDNSYDVIVFGGLGRVSSVGIDGNIHWQTLTESRWGDLSLNMRRSGGRPVPDDVKEEFFMSFEPSRILMPLEVSGPKVAVAVTGWNMISVVDLVEGTLLAQHSIPAPSTGPLVYGDFDNDGLMDLILTCKKGYIGFSLKLQHNYELTLLYTVSVFLLIILFSWLISTMSQSDNDSENDDDELDENDEILAGDDTIAITTDSLLSPPQ